MSIYPEVAMTCLSNKAELIPGSDYKEKAYAAEFAVLYAKVGPPPAFRGNFTLVGSGPLPYKPGEVYKFRISDVSSLVVATEIPKIPGTPA